MFYSEKLNILFIAAPKTGSTSIEKFLLKLDPDGHRFKIPIDGRIIDSSMVKSGSLGHATAQEFKDVLGADRYDALSKIGFVRDPAEKMVSAYRFTRETPFSSVARIRTSKSKPWFVTKRIISLAAAKFLPFSLWALVYPMKKCSDYFLDSAGSLMVNYLGSTNRIDHDLVDILTSMGIDVGNGQVPHLNKSGTSGNRGSAPNRSPVAGFLARRYAADERLYLLVKDGYHRENQEARGI